LALCRGKGKNGVVIGQLAITHLSIQFAINTYFVIDYKNTKNNSLLSFIMFYVVEELMRKNKWENQ